MFGLFRHSARSDRLTRSTPAAQPRLEPLEDRVVPSAASLDLTTRGAAGTVNGALFQQLGTRPVGKLDPFVELQAPWWRGVEQGYNTAARRTEFDELPGRHAPRALRLDEVPVVQIGGKAYREFILDVSEGRFRPLLSLDQLRIYTSNDPALRGYNPTTKKLGGQTAIYDLDAGRDNWVKIDARLGARGQQGDVAVYLPNDWFRGAGTYVTLYSRFGEHCSASGGSESWSVRPPARPQLGSIGGKVFEDTNGNGVQDQGEGGLTGFVVFLDTNDNGVLDANEPTAVAGDDGSYLFSGLQPNTRYVVGIVLQEPDFSPTTPDMVAVDILAGQNVAVDFGQVGSFRPS